MKIYIYLLIAGFASTAIGQDVEFKSSNFKDNKDAYKLANEAFELGNEQWNLGNEQVFIVKSPQNFYLKALEQYDKAYAFNPKSAELNFKIGVSHIYSTDKTKAIPFIKEAYKLNPLVDPFINYYMGYINQLEENYKEAITYYNKFEEEYRKADDFAKFVKQRKNECNNAIALQNNPIRAWIDHVPELSSNKDDYAPSVSMDGGEIIFTSNRKNEHSPNEVGVYDDEIYSSSLVNGKWQKPTVLKGPINTEGNDVSNNLSYDGTKMLMSKENADGNTDVYESFLRGAEWSDPVSFSRDINFKTNEKYAAYDFDGRKIYFSKDKENGENGYDIMVSGVKVQRDRSWGFPTKEQSVSSTFNDGPIYMHLDGKTMYIASEGFNSMGGYDIFVSKKVKGGGWTKPENLGSPINTPYDDFFFAATANGKFAYIASNRAGGKGGFDIYKVTFWGDEKSPAFTTEDFLLASVAKPIQDPELVGEVKVNSMAELTVFKGLTIDAITKKAVEAVIEITDNKTGAIVESFTSNSATGKFLISLNAGGNYGIAVKADGYLFHSENFDIPLGSAYSLVNKTIELKNIKIGSKIALRNVFFDTGKSDIRAESNAELDRLVKLLKDVPALKIELSGHTDNTGSPKNNLSLSQDRADAVVAYLVSKGIAKNRLIAKGYGAEKPVADNGTSDGRQLNRRTEFEIIAN
jgi:outer membrane protein OmpA-like peptidoglycan-associated protein/tetratricopeptide (TPR) repeat protein